MMKLIFLFLAITCTSTYLSAQDTRFKWPNNAKAAVNLAYDDALNTQLDNALPALNKYNFKGSFYLTLASATISKRLAEWRALAKQGHELGNHTINHACKGSLPSREWISADNDLDNKTVSQIKQEVINANSFLQAIDGELVRTFTVPCTDTIINGENYVEQIKQYFVGIKYTTGSVPKEMSSFNVLKTPVWSPANVTGAQLIAFAKEAAKYGTIANYTFHGIGGEHLSVSTQAHNELLVYLSKNKDIYWVDTFKNISLYLNKYEP